MEHVEEIHLTLPSKRQSYKTLQPYSMTRDIHLPMDLLAKIYIFCKNTHNMHTEIQETMNKYNAFIVLKIDLK